MGDFIAKAHDQKLGLMSCRFSVQFYEALIFCYFFIKEKVEEKRMVKPTGHV